MILSDKTIISLLDAGELTIDPFPDTSCIQPVSVDLLLGTEFVGEGVKFMASETVIGPGEFMLGHTRERVAVPRHIAGIVAGKSTWARRGLMVEAAGLVDPGFSGHITLELYNMGSDDITLRGGEPICQIYFLPTDVAVGRPYGSPGLNSHYQGQKGATPAHG